MALVIMAQVFSVQNSLQSAPESTEGFKSIVIFNGGDGGIFCPVSPFSHHSHPPKNSHNSWLREAWCIWLQSSASKEGVRGNRPSVDTRELLIMEVIRVKAIQDRQGQVPALSREPRLKGVQPEVSPEHATHPDRKADELPGQP